MSSYAVLLSTPFHYNPAPQHDSLYFTTCRQDQTTALPSITSLKSKNVSPLATGFHYFHHISSLGKKLWPSITVILFHQLASRPAFTQHSTFHTAEGTGLEAPLTGKTTVWLQFHWKIHSSVQSVLAVVVHACMFPHVLSCLSSWMAVLNCEFTFKITNKASWILLEHIWCKKTKNKPWIKTAKLSLFDWNSRFEQNG